PDAVSDANEGASGVQDEEAVCVGCGCTDNNACVNEFREPCHWLKVNRQTGLGVCSSCESFLGHPLTDDAE
ncbi:hypothetical protein LAB87_004935, partial [Salmonella enterica subsp. enterica serovar Cerro]|nr:hypothetical protein [Salmonella enterica subsp. enterica serovar Cerro]